MALTISFCTSQRQQWNLNYNMTALHWATYHGNAESVRILCELGADVTMEDFRNRTAIEIAAVSQPSIS